MKGVFILLLLANLGLAAVFYIKPAGTEVALAANESIEPVELGGLVLLDEVGAERLAELIDAKARLKVDMVDVQPDKVMAPAAVIPELCTLLGPFDEVLKAEYVVEGLAALGVLGALEKLEIPGEPGYWVFLPPLPSRKEALRKLHELQAKGVDSYVIPKGDIVNGISFGMYSRSGSAEVRLAEVKKFGYEAEIKEVPRSYEELWVVVQPTESIKLDTESWQNFLFERKNVERRENYCPGVASS